MLTARPAGIVHRPEIEIAELFAREQGETPTPHRHAGQVVREIVVGGDARLRAHPDAGHALPVAEIDVIFLMQAVEELMNIDRGQIDRRDVRLSPHRIDLREYLRQFRLHHAEIHAHVAVIKQPTVRLRIPH